MAHVSFCVACMALHCRTHGILPDIPEYTRLTSSLQAAEKPEEGVLFSHTGALGWTDHLGLARDFWGNMRGQPPAIRQCQWPLECNATASCHSRCRQIILQKKTPKELWMCVFAYVCVCVCFKGSRKRVDKQTAAQIFSWLCYNPHKRNEETIRT